jgi:hypothetical protein
MYPTPNSAVKWLGSLTNVLNSWRTDNRICAQPISVQILERIVSNVERRKTLIYP